MMKKLSRFLNKKTAYTRLIMIILALYPKRRPAAIFVRQSGIQDTWLSKKAEEIQSFAYRQSMKKFHDALKTVYGPATQPLFADGSILFIDKNAIFERWAGYFNSVLNRPPTVIDSAINRLLQIEYNVMIDEFPTGTETRKAIQYLQKHFRNALLYIYCVFFFSTRLS